MQTIRLKVIDSTNRWAKEHLKEFSKDEVTLVSAEEQTAGYGRHGRIWTSPPGQNLYLSYCLFHPGSIQALTHVAALAVASLLEELALKPLIKWPNDVLLKGKKVSGILCEQQSDWAILGIGLNVNMKPEELASINQAATSLAVEKGHPLDLHEIEQRLTKHLLASFKLFKKEGFTPFLEPYKQHLLHKLGDTIQFFDGARQWQGTFYTINPDGSLSLLLDDDRTRSFHSGDFC
jgi:BirA family transcriptional regulator, biotin operon repressor / biotin---[acetyl-CoA-carboxylase] ligase